MFRILLLFLLLISSTMAFAQERASWQTIVEFLYDFQSEEEEGEIADDELLNQLYEIYCSPIDLNTATAEDFAIFPFITTDQAKDIIYYRDTHYPIFSLGELIYVISLSYYQRRLIAPFLTIDMAAKEAFLEKSKPKKNIAFKNIPKLIKYVKNEVTLRTDIPFYTKAGQQSYPDSVLEKNPNKQYRGDRLAHSLRYSLKSGNHFMTGLQMQKDAGERGIDYIAGYAMFKNISLSKKIIAKELIGGTFRASFGLGLTVNKSYNFGKLNSLSKITQIDRGLTPHTSTSETGYFTGGGTRLQFGKVTVTAFGAHNNLDATLNSDSLSATSFKTDGLHRTPLEYSKKGNIQADNFGGNIHWDINSHFQLSASAIYTHLSIPLKPKSSTTSTLYRKYSPHGQDFLAYSLSYAYHSTHLDVAGETAISHSDNSPAWSTLLTVQYRPNSLNAITLAGRRYGTQYAAINAKAFGENSSVANEQGIFLGWTTRLIPHTDIQTYFDLMYFPWLKSGVSNSSLGFEYLLQGTCAIGYNHTLLLRYSVKSKQKNNPDFTPADDEDPLRPLCYNTRHNLKLQHTANFSDNWQLRTLVNGTISTFHSNSPDRGFAIAEALKYTTEIYRTKQPLALDFTLTYFHTNSYSSRIYAFEPSLLYSFGISSYYYHGIRSILRASVPLIPRLTLNMKFALTNYFDRETISSSTEMIDSRHREDLQLQLRYKF